MAVAGLRLFEHNALAYRHNWRGSVLISFVSPLFFLTAMGVGLGELVNRHSGGVNGVPYRDFLAPGLLVATTMQTAGFTMSYPIMAKITWWKTYDAVLATPRTIGEIVTGELLWITARFAMVSAIFYAVMVGLGATHSPLAPLMILVGTLIGLSFAAPIMAFSAVQKTDSGFAALTRFVITPLFLFGGIFFPLERLPVFLQVIAWLTPLPHGVVLARALSLGGVTLAGAAIHLVVPFAYIVAGTAMTYFALRRRLVS